MVSSIEGSKAGGASAPIEFEVNGQPVSASAADPHLTLLHWLRARGLTGAKEGCAEGECGACAVAWVSHGSSGEAFFRPVNACLVPLAEMHGRKLITVEGVGDGSGGLHWVQRRMVELGGSQCGYCTPGFVVSLFCEYYRPQRQAGDPEAIGGNLCRCTGYRPILDVLRAMPAPSASDTWRGALRAARRVSLPIAGTEGFARPATLARAIEQLRTSPATTPVAGGTDLMVDANHGRAKGSELLSLAAVAELQQFDVAQEEVVIGAGLCLSDLEEQLQTSSLSGQLLALTQMLPLFASRLIRNRATLGGNLATASPVGDSAPVLLALGAALTLEGSRGRRQVPLREFFTGYRQTALAKGELIVSIHLPLPTPKVQHFYKVSKRRLDDISTAAAAFCLDLDPKGRVERLSVGLGGIAATPVLAEPLQAIAQGNVWGEDLVERLIEVILSLGTPQSDHRGSAAYRRALLGGLFRRFLAESKGLEQDA